MRALLWFAAGCVLSAGNSLCHAVPTVFTGYDVMFSKEGFADPMDPANQDPITANVILTRGNTSGIFNIASETNYMSFSSPAGTRWAFPHNNPEATISATAWEMLTFNDWETALGSAATGGPPSTLNQNAVVHLVEDDIYLDIRFTQWGIGTSGGGSFAYERAAIGTSASADFNSDGIVDGEDFLIWQRNFGTGTMFDEGDANGDGSVDAGDLTVWQGAYGGSLSANAAAIPEPSTLCGGLLVVLGCCSGRRRSGR